MNCNYNIECLGEFCSCGNIQLTILAPITAEVTMITEFNGVKVRKQVMIEEGVNITIPNIFNENYEHLITFNHNGQNIFDKTFSIIIINCTKSDKDIEDEPELTKPHTHSNLPLLETLNEGKLEEWDSKATTDYVDTKITTLEDWITAQGFITQETDTIIGEPTLDGSILTIRYTGENGVEQSKDVDLSAFNIDAFTDEEGHVIITQNNVTIVTLSKVATTGSYNDLKDKPSATTFIQNQDASIQSGKFKIDGDGTVKDLYTQHWSLRNGAVKKRDANAGAVVITDVSDYNSIPITTGIIYFRHAISNNSNASFGAEIEINSGTDLIIINLNFLARVGIVSHSLNNVAVITANDSAFVTEIINNIKISADATRLHIHLGTATTVWAPMTQVFIRKFYSGLFANSANWGTGWEVGVSTSPTYPDSSATTRTTNNMIMGKQADYYTKLQMQTAGQAQLNWSNLSGKMTATYTAAAVVVSANSQLMLGTTTVQGASVRDVVHITQPDNALIYKARVTASGTVTIYAVNPTSSSITTISETLNLFILK